MTALFQEFWHLNEKTSNIIQNTVTLSSDNLLRREKKREKQCCGSVRFCYGSGSADPYLSLTDPDSDPDRTPDPGIFVSKTFKMTTTVKFIFIS